MPHSYTIEEEVEERGSCQQVPSMEVGDMWYDEDHRLCVVDRVHFLRYVWEDVALWKIQITAYQKEEITADLRNRYDAFQQKQSSAPEKPRKTTTGLPSSLSEYDQVLPFNKDKDLFIAKLKNRNKKDFYDPDYIAYIVHSKGNRVSKEFHVIDALKGGMAKVARKGVMGKMNYGFIDDMGKIVVPVEYLTLSDFEDGFAYGTKLTGSCGCTRHTQYRIDQNGKAEVCINNRFIERRQFNCCQDLVEVTIPEAAWIGEGAFAGCRNLKIIHIPENVKKIDKYAFQGCTALTDIVFPPHLEEICDGVLSGCESLKNIVIPDSVIVLDNAFAQCNSLKTIKIPSSVRTINSGGGLDCCKKLESINVSPQNKNYTSIDGVLYDKAMERIVAFPQNAPIKDYVIPIKSRYFGYTFFECNKLERIVLPESVRSVGNFISNRCERLREVVLPESLQKIDRELFYCCPNLKNIVLSKNLYTSSLRFLPKGINYQFR